MGNVARSVRLIYRYDSYSQSHWSCDADLIVNDRGEPQHWRVLVDDMDSPVHDTESPGRTPVLILPPEWQPTPFNQARVGTAMLALVLPLDTAMVPVETVVQLAGQMVRGVERESWNRVGEVKHMEQARTEVLALLDVLCFALVTTLSTSVIEAFFVRANVELKSRPIAAALLSRLDAIVRSAQEKL